MTSHFDPRLTYKKWAFTSVSCLNLIKKSMTIICIKQSRPSQTLIPVAGVSTVHIHVHVSVITPWAPTAPVPDYRIRWGFDFQCLHPGGRVFNFNPLYKDSQCHLFQYTLMIVGRFSHIKWEITKSIAQKNPSASSHSVWFALALLSLNRPCDG